MSIAIPAIVVIVVVVLLLLRTRRRRADTVQGDTPASPFPDTAGGAILRRYAEAISDPGMDETRLALLRQELADAAAEVLPALAATWRATPEQETGLRWALVYSAPVAGPAAVPFLREVLLSAVAPERSPDPHSYSTKAWDSIVRSRAVDGLESLAAAGAPGAESALFECLSHELFSVRALSAVALLSLPGGAERREQVRRALPEAERSVVNIQRVRVSAVPQIRDPRKHLASPVGHRFAPPPAPRGDRAAQPVQPAGPRPRRQRMRPPKISGGENG